MASIKVGMRCRPFSIEDKLGVYLLQNSETEGEVNLLNSNYKTERFAFSYSWWSAHNAKKYCTGGNEGELQNMKFVTQEEVYAGCGSSILETLLDGHAVVLFANGLSGSGKTYTVFGPDAPELPEAWFKHSEPQELWGIFPRMAFEMFRLKQEASGWKVVWRACTRARA